MQTERPPSCTPPSHPGNRRTLRVRSEPPSTAFTKGEAILDCLEDPARTALGVPERVAENEEKVPRGPQSAHHPINLGVESL